MYGVKISWLFLFVMHFKTQLFQALQNRMGQNKCKKPCSYGGGVGGGGGGGGVSNERPKDAFFYTARTT
jgi:hypothetical protein